jgi:drug/metabolite transporter (DMT)-like permease
MASEPQVAVASRSRITTVDLAMLSVALVWGINSTVVKSSLQGWDQLAFNAIRFTAAAVLLFGYVVLTDKQWRLSRRDLWRVLLLGLVGNGLYQWLFIEGIARTTASNTSLIIGMSPLVVTLWGAVTGIDRLTAWVTGGAVISVLGVSLVVLGQEGGFHLDGATMWGDLIALGAMVSWAAYTVYARPVITRVGSSLRVTAWAMLFGAVTNLLIGVPALLRQDYSLVSVGSVAGMAYSCLMSLVFGYVVYAWAVRRVGGARTAIYINLTPVIAALVAWVFIGEKWSAVQWAGAILVVGGVTVAKLEGVRGSNRGGTRIYADAKRY